MEDKIQKAAYYEGLAKELGARESFLIKLLDPNVRSIGVAYTPKDIMAGWIPIFSMTDEEKQVVKEMCQKRIKELREKLKPVLE